MSKPLAYVLYIDRDANEPLVWLYQTFDAAEAALRDYAETIILGPSDDEIVEWLAEHGIHARIYGCVTVKRRPFARTARAA